MKKKGLFLSKSAILALRPKTLVASFAPILVGATLAYVLNGIVNLRLIIYTFCSAACIQIATNLINDALDFQKGIDTHERLGPTRASLSGAFHPQKVLAFGFLFLLLSCFFAIPLLIKGGLFILIIGICSLFMAYAYSGGPYPLSYHGWGEVFVILFFGLIAVGGTYFILTQEIHLIVLISGLQMGFLASALIAVNNLRDFMSDYKAHKRTLAVRWGKVFAKYEISFFIFSPFILNLFFLKYGFYRPFLFTLICFPFAFFIILSIFRFEPSRYYNKVLGWVALLQFLFSALLSLGFILNEY